MSMRIDACAESVRSEHGSAALPEGGSRAATAGFFCIESAK